MITQFGLVPHFKKHNTDLPGILFFYYYVNEDKIPLVGTVCY